MNRAADYVLLILSSPSGAGKTTLTRMLQERFPELAFSVSHTTRKARPNEVDGKDYHFVDRGQFEKMVHDGAFLEWAEVHGNLYGTSHSEIARTSNVPGCRGMIFDYLVVNDKIDEAFDELRSIITAERARKFRRSALAESLLRRGDVLG